MPESLNSMTVPRLMRFYQAVVLARPKLTVALLILLSLVAAFFAQNYKVELVVTNQHGCTDTTYGLQVINGFYAVYLPNTFTPNGDGKNDVFKVEGENIGLLNFSFEVYNRWGELIFYTDNPNIGWDGFDKDAKGLVQNGVYLWKVTARDKVSGKINDYNGYVLKAK